MADTEQDRPQLYLVTPPEIELSRFPTELAKVLDTYDTACLRLSPATTDEDRIMRAADACREVAHARDVPIVIAEHALLVERLGLDGVHLGDGARSCAQNPRRFGRRRHCRSILCRLAP